MKKTKSIYCISIDHLWWVKKKKMWMKDSELERSNLRYAKNLKQAKRIVKRSPKGFVFTIARIEINRKTKKHFVTDEYTGLT